MTECKATLKYKGTRFPTSFPDNYQHGFYFQRKMLPLIITTKMLRYQNSYAS